MLLTNATLATMTEGTALMEGAAILLEGDRIAWVGPMAEAPSHEAGRDLGGRLVTPGLIDCHTHLVHGGNRAREFEMRLNGASYEEVARAGGGIVSTVRATREASEQDLLASALPRLGRMLAEGVTTVEIKSGYGLTVADEMKMLRVARALGRARPVTVQATFLAAHAVPPEFKGRADAYIDEVCLPALRAAQAERLVDSVDGFCEGIAFSPAQIERVFAEAQRLGLPVRLHAEQLSNLGGAALAARYGALSADHLEYLDEAGAKAMAQAGTVAVILPGAFYTLRETQLPPIGLLRQHGVRMAVATDCNPGTAPMTSLTLAMNMACTLFRMTPDEVLAGQRADLAIWEAQHPAELSYRIGATPLHARIHGGRLDA
jgi:imidazolonepropionase